MNRRQLAERLRDERDRLGITQKELADRIGIAQPQVARWEKAVALPAISRLPALATALDIDVALIYRWVAEATQDELVEVRRDRDQLVEKLEQLAERMEAAADRIEAQERRRAADGNGGLDGTGDQAPVMDGRPKPPAAPADGAPPRSGVSRLGRGPRRGTS